MTNFYRPDVPLSDADILSVDAAFGIVTICILCLLA